MPYYYKWSHATMLIIGGCEIIAFIDIYQYNNVHLIISINKKRNTPFFIRKNHKT